LTIEATGAARGLELELGIYFNVFAWQMLFFLGLCIGWRMAKGDFATDFLREEQYRNLFLILAGAVVALGVFDRVVEWDLLGAAVSRTGSRRGPTGGGCPSSIRWRSSWISTWCSGC
jgi:hypothetical protein